MKRMAFSGSLLMILSLLASACAAPTPTSTRREATTAPSTSASVSGAKYIAGVEAAFPPWAFVEKGEIKGISVEAMQEIAKMEGFEVEFRDLPWPSPITALKEEKIDLIVTGLSVTCERDEVMDYAIPWWVVTKSVLVAEDSEHTATTALCCEAVVGAQGGSTEYAWLEEKLVNNGVDIELRPYEEPVAATEDLVIGRLDSVFVDTDTAESIVATRQDVRIAGTTYPHPPEPYALAVSEGDPQELLPRLNGAIKALYESGKWAEIVHKYMPEATAKTVPAYMPECIETYQQPIPGLEE